MGEIADALRRARQEDADGRARGPGAPAPAPRKASPEAAPEGRTGVARSAGLAEAPVVTLSHRRRPFRRWRARALLVDPAGVAAERYRQFALRLRRLLAERDARSGAVTSALRAEGKTTTPCKLALALADLSSTGRVALVDLDLRRPSVASGLGVEPGPYNVEAVLSGESRPEQVRLATQLPSLDLYLARGGLLRAHDWIGGPGFDGLMDWLEAHYDHVVVDTSPVLLASDTTVALARIPAWVLTTTVGATRHKAVRELLRAIPRENLLGCFVNRAKAPAHTAQYGYYQESPGRRSDR